MRWNRKWKLAVTLVSLAGSALCAVAGKWADREMLKETLYKESNRYAKETQEDDSSI